MKNVACKSTKQKLSIMIFGFTLLLMSVANVSFAKDVTLAWDANQEADVAGYKVYYGTEPGTYTGFTATEGPSPIDIINATSATFVGLDDTKHYYFTVTAFNFNDDESAYANEVNSPPLSINDSDGDGYVYSVDCDDYDAAINPDAAEIYNNNIDENCNGMGDDVKVITTAGAIEAESGNLSAPMAKVADLATSNGTYIQTSTSNSGTASYNFNITAPGIYKVVARVFAANDGSDSLFVNIDNAGEVIWDFNPNSAASEFNVWREDNVTNRGTGSPDNPQYDPYIVELQNGAHSISFRGRETTAKLDYFRLVKVGDVTTTDIDQDGYDVNNDCNDNNAAINPGATEIPYNSVDENCNGMTDDDDLDQDGYNSANDCNDQDLTINPSATETPYNSVDENCNGMGDDDDLDNDGYTRAKECNDQDSTINPSAIEVCNDAIDNNCNGLIDAQDPEVTSCEEPLDLLSPTGGELWSSSEVQKTSWKVSDTPSLIDTVVIEYSKNDQTWKTLKTLRGKDAQVTSAEVAFPATRKSKEIKVKVTIKNDQGVIMGKKNSGYLTLTR